MAFSLFIEPYLHKYISTAYPTPTGRRLTKRSDLVGLLGLSLFKLMEREKLKGRDPRSVLTEEVVFKVKGTQWRNLGLKSTTLWNEQNILFCSISLNQALRDLFYREYFVYLEAYLSAYNELGITPKYDFYKRVSLLFIARYGIDEEELNIQTMLRTYRRYVDAKER